MIRICLFVLFCLMTFGFRFADPPDDQTYRFVENLTPDQEAAIETRLNHIKKAIDTSDLESLRDSLDQMESPLELNLNVNVNTEDPMMTALQWAARCNSGPAVDLLLQYGANIDDESSCWGTALCIAAEQGYTQLAEMLIERGASPDGQSVGCRQRTPLQSAVTEGHIDIVKLLLDHGADVNAADEDGDTALSSAIWAGRFDLFEFLLQKGANPLASTSFGTSMLHIAALSDNPNQCDFIDSLVSAGCPVNKKDWHGRTPLHCAVGENPSLEVVQCLLDHGAETYVTNVEGETPADIAIQRGNDDVLKLLVDHDKTPLHRAIDEDNLEAARRFIETGYDPHKTLGPDKLSYLHYAFSKNASREWFELLLDNGAPLDAESEDGITVLQDAVLNDREDVIRWLLEWGANPEQSTQAGDTLLHLAAHYGSINAAEVLLEAGCEVDQTGEGEGNTALIVAAWAGHEALVELLLKYGADVHFKNRRGVTALHYASNAGTADILLRNGADISSRMNNGLTPLHMAAERDDVELVKTLLDHGADPNARSEDGKRTPLFGSAGIYNPDSVEIARVLIQAGADVMARDSDGETPLHYAARYGNPKRAALFIEHGVDIDAKSNEGYTPLHLPDTLIHSGDSDDQVAAILLAHGADPNAEADGGLTPLHNAVRIGGVDKVTLLLKAGADPLARTDDGVTPVMIAEKALNAGRESRKKGFTDVEDGMAAVFAYALTGAPELNFDPERFEKILDALRRQIDLHVDEPATDVSNEVH